MAEVISCTMEQLLQIHASTDGRVAMLPLVAMMINATLQIWTGMKPHEEVYRCKLRLPMDIITAPTAVPAAKEYVTRMQCIWECVQ